MRRVEHVLAQGARPARLSAMDLALTWDRVAHCVSCVVRWRSRASMVALMSTLLVSGVPRHANGCEFADTNPLPGVLSGITEYSGSVPRNVAFITSRTTPLRAGTSNVWLVAMLDSGEEVAAVEVPGTRVSDDECVVKPSQALPANTTLHAFRWGSYSDAYQTTSVIDEVAPSRPEVVSGSLSFHDGTGACNSDSCGDYTSVSVELAATSSDDVSTSDRLVYVLYLGASPDEVKTTTRATSLHRASDVAYDLALWQLVDDAWIDRDVYVAVAALDQAGNLSERSAPVRIHAGDSGGCTVMRRSGQAGFGYASLGATLVLAWWRRSRRRSRAQIHERL
jgi:hypothetical protein